MEDIKAQQIEALKMAGEYCSKLINAINNITKEYEVGKLPDTSEYLKEIVNGLNWVFEVFNATKELINKEEEVIDKNVINESVMLLNSGINDSDDKKIVAALKGEIMNFVINFKSASEKEYA